MDTSVGAFVATLFVMLPVAACADGHSSTAITMSSAPTTSDAPSRVPTDGAGEQALAYGILGGKDGCLWVEDGDERFVLILPSGVTATFDEGGVTLMYEGDVVVREGDALSVTGGFRETSSPCHGGAGSRDLVAAQISPVESIEPLD